MDTAEDLTAPSTAAAVKAMVDLNELLEAMLTRLHASKPWQRHLRKLLSDVDRTLQVLRMTVVLNRAAAEVADAKEKLRVALRLAHQYVRVGRADQNTKVAVEFAWELGQRIETTVG